MGSRQHTKVRFVKCPKCAEILPEPEHCPLYICAGCGTVLQAKYYRGDNQVKGSGSPQRGGVQIDNVVHVSDVGESTGPTQSSSPVGQKSNVQNGLNDQNAVENGNSEQAEAPHSSPDKHQNGATENTTNHFDERQQLETENSVVRVSFAEGATVLGNKDSGEFGTDDLEAEDVDRLDQQCNGTIENHNQQQIEDTPDADDTSKVHESQVVENKELSNVAPDHAVTAVNRAIENEDDHHERSCKNAFDDTEKKCPGREHSHGIVSETTTSFTVEDRIGKDYNDSVECTKEQHASKNLNEPPLSSNVTLGGNGKSTAEIEPNSSACTNVVASTPSSATHPISDGDKEGSSNLPKDELKTASEQVNENFDNSAVYEPEHLRDTDHAEILDEDIKHREAGNSNKGFPRSLTKESLIYDGSVSSFDGNDDQLLEQREGHILEETLPAHTAADESSEWSNVPPTRSYANSRIHPVKRPSQELLDDKRKHENENLGSNRNRPNRDRFPPRVPFHHRDSEVQYESGSSASYMHDELPSHNMRHYPYQYEDLEPWPRKMYPKQGIMDRRRYPRVPMYPNYESSGELYHGLGPYGYYDRRRRTDSWSQSGNLHPPMPYSGEMMMNERYHTRDPYVHRHLDGHRWSAQLPPRGPPSGFYRGLYGAPPSGEISWDPYDHPYPTSSQQFMDMDSNPWAHDSISISDDQYHRDHVMRRSYLNNKEKQQVVKRYLRPMAGGAPFVTCYFCFKLLKLPEDFIITNRKTHKVRCGDCSNVLEFSLKNESSSSLIACMPTNTSTQTVSHDDGLLGVSNGETSKVESRNNKEGREESHSEESSSCVETRPGKSKSPLHRLMGYPSPNDLLNGQDIEGVE